MCTTSLTLKNSLFSVHSIFMCFVWIWQQTGVSSLYSTDWLVFVTETECLLRGTFYILRSAHTVCLCVGVDLRTAIISLYSIDWLVFITETECVYCAVHSTFCPHSVFMCFLWIWEQTANISVYSIDWDGVCLLRGTFDILRSAHTVYFCVLCGSQNKRLFHFTALTSWFL